MLSDTELGPVVAYLKRIIRPKAGNPMLHQAEITHHAGYDDFRSFAADFWEAATYPAPQSHKYETFSWSPTFYEESYWRPKSRPDQDAKHGTWRVGEAAHDQVTVAYFDLDNQFSTRTMFTIDAVEEVLKTVGVSYLLYTSYSHKPEHHKVRIIVPINREATWDEMFGVFARINILFEYQLDGSIYDQGDHLYGPTYTGDRRQFLNGKSLDVDAWLAVPLTEEDQSFAQRAKDDTGRTTRREMTPAEIETYKVKIKDFSVVSTVTIDNPAIFNPEWMKLIDDRYMGGSRHQTLYGLMVKVWLKSKGHLSFGEMEAIQSEIDLRMGFYCNNRYGRRILAADLQSVMSNIVTPSFEDDRKSNIERTLKRLRRKFSN